MARSVPWRRACPDHVSSLLDKASRATFYILHQTGPTGFILKEDGAQKKVKVYLGDPHICSCSTFRGKNELCLHILWVLIKKFRIPATNPVVWQLGLIEREINEIIRGHLSRQSPTNPPPPTTTNSNASQEYPLRIPQREIGPDDVCPICQDDLLGSVRRITYCQFGCGKSVHVKCMKIWGDHQKSTNGESTLHCPLCREDFGPVLDAPSTTAARRKSRLSHTDPPHQHLGTSCSNCHVCPVVGKCYKCCTCADYYLCHTCFSSNQVHLLHPFQFRQHSNQPWRSVPHPSSMASFPSLPPALASSIQRRSLTENDYDLLLTLDQPHPALPPSSSHSRTHPPHPPTYGGISERVIVSLPVEPLDNGHALVVGGVSCPMCHNEYVRGDWIKKLPCKHKFHRSCIDEWLRSGHAVCPLDSRPILSGPPHQHHSKHPSAPPPPADPAQQRLGLLPLSRCTRPPIESGDEVQFSITGHAMLSALPEPNRTATAAAVAAKLKREHKFKYAGARAEAWGQGGQLTRQGRPITLALRMPHPSYKNTHLPQPSRPHPPQGHAPPTLVSSLECPPTRGEHDTHTSRPVPIGRPRKGLTSSDMNVRNKGFLPNIHRGLSLTIKNSAIKQYGVPPPSPVTAFEALPTIL